MLQRYEISFIMAMKPLLATLNFSVINGDLLHGQIGWNNKSDVTLTVLFLHSFNPVFKWRIYIMYGWRTSSVISWSNVMAENGLWLKSSILISVILVCGVIVGTATMLLTVQWNTSGIYFQQLKPVVLIRTYSPLIDISSTKSAQIVSLTVLSTFAAAWGDTDAMFVKNELCFVNF